jgi:hypothetical protein
MASRVSAHGSGLRDEITTLAPCSAMRAAMARPMPREEPVTMATLPVSENKDMVTYLLEVAEFEKKKARRPLQKPVPWRHAVSPGVLS